VIVRGEAFNQSMTKCHALDEWITFPVRDCSSYQIKNSQNLYEMQRMAWIIEQKKGSFIGFLSPLDAKKRGIDVTD
jgi:hypothetical protein